MSVSTEVRRTLVKSPPELWTELSDPNALGRHLSELGEIRITSVEPETKIEWESDDASGVVQLKQSGWGTKVTLSVTRTPPAPVDTPEPEPATVIEPEPTVEPEPVAEPELTAKPESIAEPALAAEPVTAESDPVPTATLEQEPEPKLGFFARLFRRRKPVASVEPRVEPMEREIEPDPEPEVVAMAMPEPIYPEPPVEARPKVLEPAENLATELASMEAQMTAETTELLTGVLDRLGAAHHRPFSRG
jgi:hypothetical protein